MISVLEESTLNSINLGVMGLLKEKGIKRSNRNQGELGEVTYLNNVVVELTNPRSRHLDLIGRKNNIVATIAEIFWVMAGEKKIDPFLSFFLPRAKNFSDDGKTWHGAYGDRIFKHDQVKGVIDIFKKEGLDTRRAVIDIYQSELDSRRSLDEKFDIVSPRDIPCLVKGTKVWTDRGLISIEDVKKGDSVITINRENRNTEVSEVKWSGKTKTVNKFLEVIIDNGEVVRCTPEHLFLKKTYKRNEKGHIKDTLIKDCQAVDLKVGDLVEQSPLIKSKSGKITLKRDLNENTNSGNLVKSHRLFYEFFHNIPKEGIEGDDVHHRDENPCNNRKENLFLMSHSEHSSYHKLKKNSSQTQETSLRRKFQAAEYEGITNGVFHKDWTNGEVLDNVFKTFNSGALTSLRYDEYNFQAGFEGLPTISQINKRFESYDNFLKELIEKYNDIPDIISDRKERIKNKEIKRGRILSIKEVEETVDVFDLSIDKNSNFMLENGTFIHNCNNLMHFFVDNEQKLCCNVFQRSGDLIWGFGSINIPEFTVLQEYIAQEIGVELGSYTHWVTNLHIYDNSSSQVEEIMDEKNFIEHVYGTNELEMVFPDSDSIPIQHFFAGIVSIYENFITSLEDFDFEFIQGVLKQQFEIFHVPIEENLLYDYSKVITAYIYQKKYNRKVEDFDIDLEICSKNLKRALNNSHFKKFEVT
jgi:hypothetical protein